MLLQDHAIDPDIWEAIKYLLVVFGGIAIWQFKELLGIVKQMLEKVTILEVNSNNTTEKVSKIEHKQDQLIESNQHLHNKVESHEKDLHRIKKVVFKD
jgi:hypothetical protein